MSNIFLAWQNRGDEGTLTGGSWQAALPLSNLQTRQVQKVARSSNAALASTLFSVDLGSAKSIGAVALVVHNISVDGRVRISGADDTNAWNNIVTSSNDLTDAAWSKSRVTAVANSITAPDGTTTATKLTETAFNAQHIASQSMGTLVGQRFVEAWFKANGRTKGRLRMWNGLGEVRCDFDLTAGTVSNITGGGSIRAYDDGWYKVMTYGVFYSAATTIEINLLDASGNDTYLGDGTSGMYVWGVRSSTSYGCIDDSGYVKAWPNGVIPQDLLEWEDDNFWFGTLTSQQRAGFQSPYIYKLPSLATLRYWKVEVLDSTNTDTYIQIGRLFMAKGWTPTVNYSYGQTLGYEDPSIIATALSGAEYFDRRSSYRTTEFTLDYMSDTEAYSYALELQRLAGIAGEVLIMPDGGSDVGQKPLRSYVGRLKQVGKVAITQPTTYSVKFEVKELL